MKKSELKSYIKEEILDTLNESPSSEELRMARQAVYRFMKYRQVEAEEAIRDLINALEELQRRGVKGKLSEEIPSKEEVEALNKELEKTVKLKDEAGIQEDEDEAPAGDAEIEKKASKQDLIIKNYDKLRKELKSHLKDYQNAKDEAEKEKHLQQMKKISQSAEYLDAKAKYDKLKQIK